MSNRGGKAAAAGALSICVLALSSLTCASLSAAPEIEEGLYLQEEQQSSRQQEQAQRELIELGLTQTAVAEIMATRAAAPPPEEAQAPLPPASHVPVIQDVDFPAVVLVDGKRAEGMITFTDAGRDVNRISIQALEGTFPSGSWDPGADLKWADDEGRAPFSGVCGRQESVRCLITLHDAAGNASEGYVLAFFCQ